MHRFTAIFDIFRSYRLLNKFGDVDKKSCHLNYAFTHALGMEEEVIANMSRCPDVEVYKKEDMPMYSQSVRIAPVIIKAKDGIVIRKTKQEADDWPYGE